jgi:hypothetical protein
MDNNGNWYKDTSLNPGSGKYNPAGAAATHIPIQNP